MAALPAWGVGDDFDDGDDAGWTRFDPLVAVGAAPSDFTFPGGGYRLKGSVPPIGDAGPARVFTYRPELDLTDFYSAVDIVDWNNDINQAFGILARATTVGLGSTNGYVCNYNPNQTGSRPGGQFQINRATGEAPAGTIAAANVTLDPDRSYRIVFSGVGDTLTGALYDLEDLTAPLAVISTDGAQDERATTYPRGAVGLFNFYRGDATDPVGSPDTTFDNFVAEAADPHPEVTPGAAHGVEGVEQVAEKSPASGANFYPAHAGLSFLATTLGGGAVDPGGLTLVINGENVTASAEVAEEAGGLRVTYRGLQTNLLYAARVELAGGADPGTVHRWSFDTFEPPGSAGASAGPFVVIEAEDYNYGGGGFQDDPPPSGPGEGGGRVNGEGVGYTELAGVSGVDFSDDDTSPEGLNSYRPDDPVGLRPGSDDVEPGPLVNDAPRAKFTDSGAMDFQVFETEAGEWLNYTRTFPAGRYRVYLRAAARAAQTVGLDRVTSDPTAPGQATEALGSFAVPNTVSPQEFCLFPLAVSGGGGDSVTLSGETTLRLTVAPGLPVNDFSVKDTLYLNYLLFEPVSEDDPDLIVARGTPFGDLPAGTGSVTAFLPLRNAGGAAALTVEAAEVTGPAADHFSLGAVPGTLAPGAGGTIAVTFDPAGEEGAFVASLLLRTDDPGESEVLVDLFARTPLASGLLAHYRMDEGGGESLVDASGLARDGAYRTTGNAAVEFGRPALAAGGSVFLDDGGADAAFAEVPRAAGLPLLRDLTLSLWFEQDPGDAGSSMLVAKGTEVAEPFNLVVAGGAVVWGAGGVEDLIVPEAAPAGAAHHLALTYAAGGPGGGGNVVVLYIDGQEVGRKENAATFEDAENLLLQFGARGGELGFKGLMDDVQVYGRALSAEEVTFLRANPGTPIGGGGPGDDLDSDGDGLTDAAETAAGSDPGDPFSAFRVNHLETTAGGGFTLRWSSGEGIPYQVLHRAALEAGAWTTIAEVTGAAGANETGHTDDDPARTAAGRGFYRVAVAPGAP